MKIKLIMALAILFSTSLFATNSYAYDCSGLSAWNSAATYNSSNQVQHNNAAYQAKWWTKGDDPTQSEQWGVWNALGTCAGGSSSGGSSSGGSSSGGTSSGGNSSGGSSSGGSGGCTAVQYIAGTRYSAGQTVQNNNHEYSCDIAGWCSSAASVYEPGTGTYWSSAWTDLGVCTGGGSSGGSSSGGSSSGGSSSGGSSSGGSSSGGSGGTCADQNIDMAYVNTYPNWPQVDWQNIPHHASANDLVCHENTVYKAKWETSTTPGSDSGWETTCTGTCDSEGSSSGGAPGGGLGGPDRASNDLTLTDLPYQISVNQGANRTVTFSGSISSIVSRNRGVASYNINGSSVTFNGLKAGRTGLKITSGGTSYYMGLRTNNANGSVPGLPSYLSVGSVSEDTTPDLDFWKDIDTDMTNKEMDIRYIYINGGPIGGWRSWNGLRVINFARESLRLGLIPFFVYYNIPDGGESLPTDLAHITDVTYMTAYFEDIDIFLTQAKDVLQDEFHGIILEPDFMAYFQQNSGGQLPDNAPTAVSTVVNATTIAANAGNMRTLVERINKTIADQRTAGSNIIYGWMLNLWSYAPVSGSKGVLRRTDSDDLGFTAGRAAVLEAATATTQYAIDAGVLTHGADFLSIDRFGLDAAGTIGADPSNPATSIWYFNNDHWMNYLYYVETMKQTSGLPIVLWQLPVGHINGSTSVSAHSGSVFQDLPNTNAKYEGTCSTFFLGDTFNAGNAARTAYFAENKYNDPKLHRSGSTITWGNHMQETKNAGVISVLFGAGVGHSTDGVGSPPTDDYFWIQKVQEYFETGAIQ